MPIIKIIKPVFKCEEDENIFLMRLSEISACENVMDKNSHFLLVSGVTDLSLIETEIQEICDIWNSTYKIISWD